MRASRKPGVLYRVPSTVAATETFTPAEAAALSPYFGNTDSPIFVLTNLPEVVKGALFARYSRSAKSVRRLFLDEFLETAGEVDHGGAEGPGSARAETLYRRVFDQYGDDSVAQLGGAHLACEGVSNVLTKVLERGRLMSYLEQSTRYVPYTQRPDGRWKYVIPGELQEDAERADYAAVLDRAFETYARWIEPMQRLFRERHPQAEGDSDGVYRAVIRAKALDTLRGLLPAATRSNVGIYGSGQAWEALLLRMRAHTLAESREVAGLMLPELRKVIPAFLQRVDREDRGVRWSGYLREQRAATEALAASMDGPGGVHRGGVEQVAGLEAGAPAGAPADAPSGAPAGDEVTLTDFDPDGEVKVVAAALYAASDVSHGQLLARARAMSTEERVRALRAYAGERSNRRHRPGRAFEHADYTFDILSDYGAFRDLQRHRLLTLDWQALTARHGCTRPEAIDAVGARDDWDRVMGDSADLAARIAGRHSPLVAQYAVAMAYRIRFYMRMNAREAMHVIELRTTPQGHPAYRRVCQRMHRLIAERAGHRAIAEAMTFADHSEVELERLDSERASERKRTASPPPRSGRTPTGT
ncbi:MAG: thymidylate synthase [Acidobacteria bacterium]|nr:thymidylate synthase [Acidobacteriota bacterium]MYJ05864.1 thymidylate synthase [Acidobacteriota bacterium]